MEIDYKENLISELAGEVLTAVKDIGEDPMIRAAALRVAAETLSQAASTQALLMTINNALNPK